MKSAHTSPNRIAAIDIGTNTILLLASEWDGKTLHPLLEKERIARLGEGVHQRAILSKEAMERGLGVLREYLIDCQRLGIQKVFAAGTSALREARNASEFLKEVKEKLDLSIEIISGEEEAHLSYLAVSKDLKEEAKRILVADVGGGSTELILGFREKMNHWVSLPMGSVRYTEQFLHSDPVRPEEWREMENEIEKTLNNVSSFQKPDLLVSVGGTATTLAQVEMGLSRFNPRKIHHFKLTQEAIRRQILLYRSKTQNQRKTIQGLSPLRADVILAGATILYKIMETMNCHETMISCHGVRYGLLYSKLSDTPKLPLSSPSS